MNRREGDYRYDDGGMSRGESVKALAAIGGGVLLLSILFSMDRFLRGLQGEDGNADFPAGSDTLNSVETYYSCPDSISFPGGKLELYGRTFWEAEWPDVARWSGDVNAVLEAYPFGNMTMRQYLESIGLDPLNFILSMVWVESSGVLNADDGISFGLMGTVTKEASDKYSWAVNRPSKNDLWDDPREQIRTGVDILAQSINQNGGFFEGLSHYNTGDNYANREILLHDTLNSFCK